ncbi:glycosyltransferase family 4 protein [Polaribacter sp.]|uniref:glycosyltransferase family 4 protein n=1 Tax=Polaribacter sp. TaxID=1920175 RepID=UPI0025D4C71E|nr:glycosyltransferase family 4 protein [Polaribacter sp.]
MSSSKNILIISPFFFPEPISTGKFNTDFAISLKDKGHNVTVLCYHPFYPDWKIKKNNSELKGIKIIRGGKFLAFSKKTIIRRIILEFSFAFYILRKIKKYQKNTDIIIPVFPPSFAFLSILPFLNKKIKKVGMVHDLQEVYSIDKNGFVNNLVQFFIHRIEKKCYNSCNKLIFLSKEMKEQAKDLYQLNEDLLEVQYPFITIKARKTNNLDYIFKNKNKHIVYSGALGEKQNPKRLYDFFNEASLNTNNVSFHFFSEGEEINKLKKINTNSDIHFHKLVDKECLEELYDRSDVQMIPQKEGTSKGSLPSKLPNLLASQCKVLLITDPNSELEKFFTDNNLDFVTNNWDATLLIQCLKKLLNKDVDFDRQNKIAKNFFTIDKMIQKVLS